MPARWSPSIRSATSSPRRMSWLTRTGDPPRSSTAPSSSSRSSRATRSRISPWSGRPAGCLGRRLSARRAAARRAARRRDRQPAGLRRDRDRRRRQRAWTVACHARRSCQPPRRERHPDRRGTNPGNSGGALADSRGRVIGINTAVAGIGLGLAVPIDGATRRILESLIVHGRVRRAFLGIVGGTRPLGQAVADRIGRARGLEVVQLLEPGPAASAGCASATSWSSSTARRSKASATSSVGLSATSSGGASTSGSSAPADRTPYRSRRSN